MKILEKEVKTLYRFRCYRCRSKFEMTAQEKRANDLKYTDKGRFRSDAPHNPEWKFNCPICGRDSMVLKQDQEIVHVMDNKNEVTIYG